MPISVPDMEAGVAQAAVGAERARNANQEKARAEHAERMKQKSMDAEKQIRSWSDVAKGKEHREKTITSGDVNRLDLAKVADETNVRLAHVKFESLTGPLAPDRARLISDAQTAINSIPELKIMQDYLSSLATPDLRNAAVENWLRNLDEHGDIGRAIQARRDELIKDPRPKSEKLNEATNLADNKRTERDEIVRKHDTKQSELKENRKAAREFDPGGAKAAELAAQQGNVDAFINSYNTIRGLTGTANALTEAKVEDMRRDEPILKAQAKNLSDRLKTARSSAAVDNDLVDGLINELEIAERRIDEIAGVLPVFDQAASGRNQLRLEEKQVRGDSAKLRNELNDLTKKKTRAEAELASASSSLDTLQAAEENAYVSELQNVPLEALKKLYYTRYTEAVAKDAEVSEALIKKETDPLVKSLMEMADNKRWRELDRTKLSSAIGILSGSKRFVGENHVEKFNEGQIRTDIVTLRAQGAEGLARNMLKDAKDPAGNRIYSDAQIDELVASPRFKEVANTNATKLLARAIQRDQLTPKDKEFIEASDWGKGIIEKATNEHKDWIEDKKHRFGFLGSTAEFLKKNPKFKWLLLLTIVAPNAGMLVIGGYSGYRFVQEVRGKKAEH